MSLYITRSLLLILLFLALSAGSCSQANQIDTSKRIDAIFAAYDEGDRPGFAIGVIRKGELIYANGFGQASIGLNADITPDTSFNIASLSKQFTAAITAMDIEANRIALEDHLSDHWPNLPQHMGEISMAHLVYMTSGLPEYYTLPSPRGRWTSESKFTVDDAVTAVMASKELEYDPGTRWTYSNINYQILAETAARLNHKSFGQLTKDRIFAPLGMNQSWVDAPIDMQRDNRATSHVWESNSWQVAPRLSPHYGGSGVFASVRDLAKWDRALYTDKHFGESFTELMLSTRKFDHDKSNDAFGLVHGSYLDQSTIWYEGGDYGASAYMVRLPERDETIICLANFANAGCVSKARMVIDILLAFE